MLGVLSRRRASAPRACRPLGLETLEDRNSPSTLTLSVTYGSGRNVTLSGTLSDHPNPGGQTINFAGKVSGAAVTSAQASVPGLGDVTVLAADGSSHLAVGVYSVTLQATGLGDVTAQAA